MMSDKYRHSAPLCPADLNEGKAIIAAIRRHLDRDAHSNGISGPAELEQVPFPTLT